MRYFIFLVIFVSSCVTAQNIEIDVEKDLDLRALLMEKQRLEAVIRSRDDLALYVAINEHFPTPLAYFTEGGLSRFVKGLKFTSHGLASFDDAVIRQELSPDQAFELLELFGIEHVAKSLYKSNERIQCQGGYNAALCDDYIPGYVCSGISSECESMAGNRCSPSRCWGGG